jgi:hypothetical protein
VGSYLSNLQVRIEGALDREKLAWAVRAVMDTEPIRAGATLRSSKKLPALLQPSPIRTISIAPEDPGVKWIGVYDDEASYPGHQLTKMAQELSTFLERPIVAISLTGSLLYAGLVDEGEIWDSITRPLDQLEADDDPDSYRGHEGEWVKRLGVDGDRLREAWDAEYAVGEQRLFALSNALAMNHARSAMGPKYLLEQRGSVRPVDEPGFTVLRFRWTAPGWAPEP